jgi:hypothetical protein
MLILPEQFEAWKACVEYAKQHHWWAVYHALSEDGPDDITDFVTLLKEWKESKEQDSYKLLENKKIRRAG